MYRTKAYRFPVHIAKQKALIHDLYGVEVMLQCTAAAMQTYMTGRSATTVYVLMLMAAFFESEVSERARCWLWYSQASGDNYTLCAELFEYCLKKREAYFDIMNLPAL
jgi:hypothetical protein